MTTINMTGYHGTALENVADILENQFTANKRHDHWLGQGIYFYDDVDIAKWWIETKLDTRSVKRCAVIEATLCCRREEFWDLDRPKDLDRYFRELNKLLREMPISLRFKKDQSNRVRNFCLSLDLLKQALNLKLIAMTFQKTSAGYARGNVEAFERHFFPLPLSVAYKERQFCASNNDTIASKKRVYP